MSVLAHSPKFPELTRGQRMDFSRNRASRIANYGRLGPKGGGFSFPVEKSRARAFRVVLAARAIGRRSGRGWPAGCCGDRRSSLLLHGGGGDPQCDMVTASVADEKDSYIACGSGVRWCHIGPGSINADCGRTGSADFDSAPSKETQSFYHNYPAW